MRQRDKVLDDLRNVQSRDRTSLKKASMSSHRTAQRIRTKMAKRKRPYGAKKTPPVEDLQPPAPMDHSATDTAGGSITFRDCNGRVIYISTTGSNYTQGCW